MTLSSLDLFLIVAGALAGAFTGTCLGLVCGMRLMIPSIRVLMSELPK